MSVCSGSDNHIRVICLQLCEVREGSAGGVELATKLRASIAARTRKRDQGDSASGSLLKEHRTLRRSGLVTEASMVGRQESPGSIYSIGCKGGYLPIPQRDARPGEWAISTEQFAPTVCKGRVIQPVVRSLRRDHGRHWLHGPGRESRETV